MLTEKAIVEETVLKARHLNNSILPKYPKNVSRHSILTIHVHEKKRQGIISNPHCLTIYLDYIVLLGNIYGKELRSQNSTMFAGK